MGQCTSTPSDQNTNCESITWLKNASTGVKPPKYIRIIVKYHDNTANISGYYRNISVDYPRFNAFKNSNTNFPAYIRVLDIEGKEIKPNNIHYLYSSELIEGSSWVIATYNALQKHPPYGHMLCRNPYNNFKNYFAKNASTQVVNLEHQEYDSQNRDHTNIYKVLSSEFKQCDTCLISIIPFESVTKTINVCTKYIDTIFKELYTNQLLLFDVNAWDNTSNDKINLFTHQREHIYQSFFGPKCDEYIQYKCEFEKLRIKFKDERLKELGFNIIFANEYDSAMQYIQRVLYELNPNDQINGIVENEKRYQQIVEQHMENIKGVLDHRNGDEVNKQVLTMVFPDMYKEQDLKGWH